MPPGTRRVLPELLEAHSTRLKRLRGDELQAAIADLRTLSQRLDAAWSSEASAAFGDGFSSWLTRAERRGQDLERIAAFLSATAAAYRALEADLVDGATEVPERPHHQDATHAQAAPGNAGGSGPGMGGGIYAGAGGTFSPIALTGNPLEDLWNWLKGLFGAAPEAQAAPTPTPRTPITVGVNPWPTPSQFPWEAADSDDAHSVVCAADPSTTPANLQPYLINAACTNLIGQLEPDRAALLIQQVNSGQTVLTPMLVNGFWVLQAKNALTGETHILATVQDEDGTSAGNGETSGGGSGAGPSGAQDPEEVVRLIRQVQDSGTKISPEKVTWIRQLEDSRIVWLEEGNDSSGFAHIVDGHADQFANKGVPVEQIPALIEQAVTQSPVIGTRSGGSIYTVEYNGRQFSMLVVISHNGYIVSAYPITFP